MTKRVTFIIQIKTLWRGEANAATELVYIAIAVCNLFTWMFVALSQYPHPYGMMTNTISDLGNTVLNPNGWFFLSIGIFSSAFLFIPHVRWINKTIRMLSSRAAKMQATFLAIAIFGWIGVGIFNESMAEPHGFFAAFFFGGLLADTVYTTFTMARQIRIKMPWPRLGDYILLEAAIYSTGAWLIFKFATNTEGISGLYITEWVFFFGLLGWLIGYVVVISRASGTK
jgi:hypothetical membrane protein